MAKLIKESVFINILKGTVKSKVTFVAHGNELYRRDLLRIIAQQFSKTDSVHVIMFDSFDLKAIFDATCKSVVEYKLNSIFDEAIRGRELNVSIGSDVSCNDVAVIDSLDPLLIHMLPLETTHFIDYVRKKFKRLVCLLSADLPTELQLILLRDQASSYIRLDRVSPFAHNKFRAQLLHKRSNSKTRYEICEFVQHVYLDLNRQPCIEVVQDSSKEQKSSAETTDLPFEISLIGDDKLPQSSKSSPANKQKRKEHVQPFIRAQSESKVFYTPDKNDDIDEEDPDDDLNF